MKGRKVTKLSAQGSSVCCCGSSPAAPAEHYSHCFYSCPTNSILKSTWPAGELLYKCPSVRDIEIIIVLRVSAQLFPIYLQAMEAPGGISSAVYLTSRILILIENFKILSQLALLALKLKPICIKK